MTVMMKLICPSHETCCRQTATMIAKPVYDWSASKLILNGHLLFSMFTTCLWSQSSLSRTPGMSFPSKFHPLASTSDHSYHRGIALKLSPTFTGGAHALRISVISSTNNLEDVTYRYRRCTCFESLTKSDWAVNPDSLPLTPTLLSCVVPEPPATHLHIRPARIERHSIRRPG